MSCSPSEREQIRLRQSVVALIHVGQQNVRWREGAIPNTFAYFALFAWPVVCIVLFVMLPVEAAAIWSLLGGYLLLPSATSVDAVLLPPLDKFTIPSIAVFLLCWMKGSQYPPPQRSFIIYLFAIGYIVSPVLTSLTNSYEIQIGNRSLPGFYPMDGLKYSLHNIIELAPFFIGMRFLSTHDARSLLIKAISISALFYSLPMWFEIRLSPQLHRWVYGFFPHSFAQQYRDGGFRPVVFLGHGLEVAFFASIAVISALIGMRARWKILGYRAGPVAGYLAVLLLFCKTLGASLYALIAAPIVLFTRPKNWVNVAVAILLLLCAYPLLRTYDLVPVHHITEAANSISADRSGSFRLRVTNEDMLLAKANQKAAFGWGAWGRNRVYQKGTGEDLSITDGEWIMQFGTLGWFGYLSLFGLFAVSVWRARAVVRGPVTQNSVVIGGLTLLLAVNGIDLIPNAGLRPLTYLLAGSIAGCVAARYPRKLAGAEVKRSPAVATAS